MFLHFFGIVFMGENPRQSAEQIEGLWVIHGAECEVCFCHANAQCFYLRSSLGREKTLKFMLLWSDWSPRRLWAEWWVQTFFWFYSSLQCGLSLTLPFSCSLINYYAYNKLVFLYHYYYTVFGEMAKLQCIWKQLGKRGKPPHWSCQVSFIYV